MSRFFRAGSDSDESDYSDDDNKLFRKAADTDSDEDESESEEEDESEDDDDDEPKPTTGKSGAGKSANALSKFGKGAVSDDSDDDSDDNVRVVKSVRDKRFEEMRTIVRALNNGKKINDWAAMQNEFEKLNKAWAKTSAVLEREGGVRPRFYFRTLAQLEDLNKATLEKKDVVKKMNTLNAKALNAMKQKLKKHNKTLEADIEAWRANPVDEEASEAEAIALAKSRQAAAKGDDDGEDSDDSYFNNNDSSDSDSDSDSDEDDSALDARARVLKKFGKKPEKEDEAPKVKKVKVKKVVVEKAPEEEEGDEEGGFTSVGKSGKAIEVTPENLYKKLTELLVARGKKSTDKVAQVTNFKRLLEVAGSPHQKAQVLLALIPAQFDFNPVVSGFMPTDLWKSARSHIDQLLSILESNPNIHVADFEKEDLEPQENEQRFKNGEEVHLRGNLNSFLDRLDDEFTKSLQNIDPHTTEYIERLKDETAMYVLIVRCQAYFEKIKSTAALDNCIMRRVEHIYYKPDYVITVIESALPIKSKVEPKDLVHSLCVALYQTENVRVRARALLCHVYHLALHGKYYEARDMLLMSHLQEQAQHTDIMTQILYNRTMVQMGICAFRCGLVRDAANALQEISASGKVKELLAQGFQLQRYAAEKSAEQEKLEKQRQLPFHMHINLELLECVYLTCSMLLEIPNMAMHSHDSRRKVISKPFRRMLDYNERQVFTGPPENTRDHIMGAAKALSVGEWQKCRTLIQAIKIWELMPDASQIKDMLGKKIQEEGLRTYIFQYAPYYDSLGLEQLATMFDLSAGSVHAIVSKMIINEELHASMDEPSKTVVLHRNAPGVEMSRLEYLAGVYAEKVSTFVDGNEKLLESRSIMLGLQQQQQAPQVAGGATGGSGYRGSNRTGGNSNTGGGRGGRGGRGGSRGGRTPGTFRSNQ
ncbi:Translation initiation factor 3 subunit c [Blyttiomyces sp. JEL0837]|nr:Translation initiation factor 3 subunit c [Blyttiomyces sp. JEL0837]